ncbi:DUF1770-domain-containing protein, partial [Rhizodiscina lignyota]
EIASAIQSASIEKHPSPEHDINPSTAASSKEPVTVSLPSSPEDDIDEPEAEDEIPVSVLRPLPRPRRSTLPPLPDLRFEQSYLKSIQHCESTWAVLWITFRDQVVLALAQGFLWTLIMAGWRHFNRGGAGKFSGQRVGARLRRWWWGVNGWTLPDDR